MCSKVSNLVQFQPRAVKHTNACARDPQDHKVKITALLNKELSGCMVTTLTINCVLL